MPRAFSSCPATGACSAAAIHVVVLDLLSIVPYYTGHLCASLRHAAGVRATLASIKYHHDPEFFRRQGIRNDPGLFDLASRLRRCPAAVRRFVKLIEYLMNMAALLVRFAASRPEIIHVQFLPLATRGIPVESWFLTGARALGAKLVYTVHNLLPQSTGDRYRATYKRIYAQADRLICHDVLAARRLEAEFAVPPGRISVIPHGPLFEEVSSEAASRRARAKLGFAPGECVVLWQGILRPYKGVPFLLKAWRQVSAADLTACLAIVGTGDGDLVQAIREDVEALGIQSRVRLELRFISVQELADFYQAADVLVYPYSDITTSGALMTGLVHGKAIVATDLPVFEQMLHHGETALLVRYGDVDGLAGSLRRLIADAEFRHRLGARLREDQSRSPRWPDIAGQTCECYRAALSQQRDWTGQAVRT